MLWFHAWVEHHGCGSDPLDVKRHVVADPRNVLGSSSSRRHIGGVEVHGPALGESRGLDRGPCRIDDALRCDATVRCT